MKKKLILTTSFYENRPVSVAGIGLWSKRTSAVEENELQKLQIKGIAPKGTDLIEQEIDVVQMLLQRRVRQAEDRELISVDWVRQNVGKENAERMIAYFRTGETQYLAAAEGSSTNTLDLSVFEDLELDGRVFRMPALNYAELLEITRDLSEDQVAELLDGAMSLGRGEGEDGETTTQMLERMVHSGLAMTEKTYAMIRQNAERVAYALNRRVADNGGQVDADWLLERLSPQQLNEVINFLRNGTEPQTEDAEEEVAPKNVVLDPAGS